MKVLLQRVSGASVQIGAEKRSIGQGLLAFAAFRSGDSHAELEWMAKKICGLRIFSDDAQKLNLSLKDVGGELLVVSQFTLYADSRKGNRPSFDESAPPALARGLYDRFLELVKTELPGKVQSGEFGADMRVTLTNDGPVTLMLEK